MKRFILCAVLAFPLLGCPTATTTIPANATAPGYMNAQDQQLGEILAGSDAYYNKLARDAKAGTFKPSASEVKALNALQASLAIANPIYTAFHAGTATQAQAASAINDVQAKQAAVQSAMLYKETPPIPVRSN